MDEREDEPVTPRPRQPICMDCVGRGVTHQPRAALVREPDGRAEMTSTLVPARCQACRGTGKAGA